MPTPGPFISHRTRKRRPPAWSIALAILGALLIAGFVFISNRNKDVHRGDQVEFSAKPPPQPRSGRDWPFYHRNLAHTAYLPSRLRPPFKHDWLFGGKVLLEFPPVVADRKLFVMRNNGSLYALGRQTGQVRWSRNLGRCAASSPAYSDDVVYVSLLATNASCSSRSGTGSVVALRAKTGEVIWRKSLASRTESSPIVKGAMLYVGSENGTVYGIFKRTGRVKWTYAAGGAVKASPALAGSTLYFGDYSGRMHAVWARTGKGRWSAGTSGARLGFASGRFYSTPAVSFGRVYAGNTDSKVYSWGAKTGELAWSKSTGGYVYSSPAAVNVRGDGPTVLIGSYDGNLYALDARTGSERWSASAGGRISGGVSVVGNVAYFADLDSKATYGVDIRTGRRIYRFPRGAYNPVVSDGEKLYVTGYASITALVPRKGGQTGR